MVRYPHRAWRDPRSVCRQADAAERAGGAYLRAQASGLAFDPDRDPRHRTRARLPDDLVRRGRALPGPPKHVRQNDHGAAHRVRAWHADGAFRTEPEQLVRAAVPDRLSAGGVGDSLSLSGAGLSEPARPRTVFLAVDDLGIAQLFDRRALDAQFAQHFLGVLAQARWNPPHPRRCLSKARAGIHRAHGASVGMLVQGEV